MAAQASSSRADLKVKIEDDVLKCPICCSQFVNPYVLSCQHTFCYRCLKGCLANSTCGPKNTIKCAICRKLTKLGKDGISSLSKNLSISHLIQVMKKSGGTRFVSRGRTTNTNNNKPSKPTEKSTTAKSSHRGGRKQRNDHEAEYRRVYRREYTPNSDHDSSESSSSDECCPCGRRRRCDCNSSSDSSSYYSSSSYDSSSSYESCNEMMQRVRVQQRTRGGGGCGRSQDGCCGGRGRSGGGCRR